MASTRERGGPPTQFHGVPLEERAIDSSGNRLPWALEWADEQPNVRHHRKQGEEKGAFGKSLRRRGPATRSTRTQTPARKENPTLDGFEAALKFDSQRRPKVQNTSAPPVTEQPAQSLIAEPAPVQLFGFPPESQYEAISFYEKISGGIICEDYDRRPPASASRLGLGTLGGTPTRRRPLTRAEQHAAAQYAGGRCWIRVTFDSRAAAERAMAASPHILHGHWVYAQPYTGRGPAADEPIPQAHDPHAPDGLGALQPHPTRPATLGASAPQRSISGSRANSSTLPANFRAPWTQDSPTSSDTVESSNTLVQSLLTAEPMELQSLESPAEPRASELARTSGADQQAVARQRHFSHFPDTPITQLRDASEALLPSPTLLERFLGGLSAWGLNPSEVIGSTVPRYENGDFDWDSSSFYWRLCYWLDSHLGTDLCGMKES